MITWGLVVLTVLAVGGILYFTEDKRSDSINMVYNVALQFFFAPDFPLSRFPSKLIQLFSLFLVAILVYVFTAASTNIFYNDKGAGVVNSLSDLADNLVMTNKLLGDRVSQYTPNPIIIEPKDISDPFGLYTFEYLIIDGPYSDYLLRQHCELSELIHQIDIINYGFVFASSVQKGIQTEFNKGILSSKEEKTFEAYTEEYYSARTDLHLCTDRRLAMTEKIGLYDSRSVFYIYLVGLGLGVLTLIISHLMTRIKRNLQLYDLRGIRGKGDKKVQRRVATLMAMHAAVSLQALEFLKRVSQEAITASMMSSRINVPPKTLDLAHRRLKHQFKDKENSDGIVSVRIESPRTQKLHLSTKSFFKSKQLFSLKRLSGSEMKPPPRTFEKRLTQTGTRRSSFLNQSMQNYKLGTAFTLKQNILADLSPRTDSFKSSPGLYKGWQTNESIHTSGGSNMLKRAKTNLPLWQRLFGKRGIKIDDSIIASAANLVKVKEGVLMTELSRKKTEFSNRASFSISSAAKRHLTVEVQKPKNLIAVSQPRLFKAKFFEEKKSKTREENLYNADSFEFSPRISDITTERFRPNDMISLDVSARSQSRLLPSYRKHKTEQKERSKKAIQPFKVGHFDHEVQFEDARNMEPVSKELFTYDFSKIIQVKKSTFTKEIDLEESPKKFYRPKTVY